MDERWHSGILRGLTHHAEPGGQSRQEAHHRTVKTAKDLEGLQFGESFRFDGDTFGFLRIMRTIGDNCVVNTSHWSTDNVLQINVPVKEDIRTMNAVHLVRKILSMNPRRIIRIMEYRDGEIYNGIELPVRNFQIGRGCYLRDTFRTFFKKDSTFVFSVIA